MSNCSCNCSCNIEQTYSPEVRTQFTVVLNPEDTCALFRAISNRNINIAAYSLLSNKCGKTLSKFIVGDSDSQSRRDINAVRCILNYCSIPFNEKQIVKVNTQNNNNDLSTLYCALQKSNKVISSYSGNDGALYFETCNINKALNVIRCINR